MNIFVLFSLSLGVALGMPPVDPDARQHPILTEDQRPLGGNWLPVQGHVVAEEPEPQLRLKEAEETGKQKNTQEEEKSQVKDEPELQAQSDVKVDLEVPEKTQDKNPEQEPEAIPKDKVDPEPPSPDFKVESEVKVEPGSQDETEFEAKSETGLEVEEKHIDMEGRYEKMDQPIMHLEPINDKGDDLNVEKEEQRTYDTIDQPIMHLEPINDEDDGVNVEEEKQRTYETKDQPIMHLEPINDEDDDVVNIEEEQRTYETMDQPIMHLEPINDEGDDVNIEEEQRTYETMDQPIIQLEPLNDEDAANVNSEHAMSKDELLEAEKTIMAEFQSPDPVAEEQPLPEEEEAQAVRNNEAVLMLEPKASGDPEQVRPGVYMMHEGPRLDALGEPMLPFEEYFPNKEDFIGLEPEIQQDPLTVDMLMRGNPEQEFIEGEESVMDNMPVMDENEINGEYQRFILSQKNQATGRGSYPGCAGVVLQGRCYVFHRGPKRAEDAEFFCQNDSTGGHLASITNEHVHREVMRLIVEKNGGYTRTWIGGLRYLKTGRFIWLDGEHWDYADWLLGEPSNVADLEDCVELLDHALGQFNDFTCWEPQAFVCSYPYL